MRVFSATSADAEEVKNRAGNSIHLQVIVKELGDLAIGVALLSERSNDVGMGLQFRAGWVVGQAVEQVGDFRVHVSFRKWLRSNS